MTQIYQLWSYKFKTWPAAALRFSTPITGASAVGNRREPHVKPFNDVSGLHYWALSWDSFAEYVKAEGVCVVAAAAAPSSLRVGKPPRRLAFNPQGLVLMPALATVKGKTSRHIESMGDSSLLHWLPTQNWPKGKRELRSEWGWMFAQPASPLALLLPSQHITRQEIQGRDRSAAFTADTCSSSILPPYNFVFYLRGRTPAVLAQWFVCTVFTCGLLLNPVCWAGSSLLENQRRKRTAVCLIAVFLAPVIIQSPHASFTLSGGRRRRSKGRRAGFLLSHWGPWQSPGSVCWL